MTFDTAIEELFQRFPAMRAEYRSKCQSLGKGVDSASIAFGHVLLPALQIGLERGDLGTILKICAYLEDAAESAASDSLLQELIRVECGNWLAEAANEHLLSPWLGAETKRICGYVPGLATQRRALKMRQKEKGWGGRLAEKLRFWMER